MIFKITSINTYYNKYQTSYIMILMCFATIPGIIIQVWFFSLGTLVQLFISITSAICAEVMVLKLRKIKTINYLLHDYSAMLTGLLLALSIPPLTPWWITILGSSFAIIIAKQLYGGIGQNIFNPAMTGYVMMLISFPAEMNNWLPPYDIAMLYPNFIDILQIIFTNHIFTGESVNIFMIGVDGTTQATPLDMLKTYLHANHNMKHIINHTLIYNKSIASNSWQWVNLTWLMCGIFLLWQKAIKWHIPISFLTTLALCFTINWVVAPNIWAAPHIYLFSGATMLGAFFIFTDPVTTAATNTGRIIFGSLAGILVWLIRSFSNYPDGVAFAVLLVNTIVPLIDYYTKPKVYGHH